ncbi:UDP-2,3-diacylglucosamine diphosphatase [Marinomonas agarivorans]|nr:UDP-2,3-diacylglucosamine diphosphatase [Marinomonas agarivorans]
MTRYFIADLHLSNERPDLLRAFDLLVDYLIKQSVKKESIELYILGDFYERWIGDDEQSLWQQSIESAFEKLLHNKIKIIVFHGNRDFLLDQTWAKRIGVILIENQLVIEDSGCRILLSHGDEACLDDTQYQEFRTMVRNPKWQRDFLARPLTERIALTTQLRTQSKAVKKEKAADIMDVSPDEITRLMQQHQTSIMIHGHTHRPALHAEVEGHRLVLGDWHNHVWLGCLENGCFTQIKMELSQLLATHKPEDYIQQSPIEHRLKLDN